jgi:putative oxidoreductase
MVETRRRETGLLILRLALGLIFVLHGWTNVIGGQESFIREMLSMAGWAAPDLLVWLITALELLGGLALMLGLFTRKAAAILAVEMGIVVVFFHAGQGFFIVAVPNVPLAYGFEYQVALIGGLACLALAGPGAFSLHERIDPPANKGPDQPNEPTE